MEVIELHFHNWLGGIHYGYLATLNLKVDVFRIDWD